MKRLIAVALVAGFLVAIPASHQFTVKAAPSCQGECGQALSEGLKACRIQHKGNRAKWEECKGDRHTDHKICLAACP